MNKLICIAAIVFAMVGCVSGTVNAPASATHQLSIPLPPAVVEALDAIPTGKVPSNASIDVPALSAPPVSEDFSSELSKISDVADSLQVEITSLTLSNDGDLSWVPGLTVSIEGATAAFPKTTLATYTSTGDPGSTLTVNVVMAGDQVLAYLEAGAVSLTVELAPAKADASTIKMMQGLHGSLNTTLGLSIVTSGSASKSL